MYDLNSIIQNSSKASAAKKELFPPAIILEWPNIHDQYSSKKRKLNLDVYDIVINKTILSHNGAHMVAVTNNNMVCIWKRKK